MPVNEPPVGERRMDWKDVKPVCSSCRILIHAGEPKVSRLGGGWLCVECAYALSPKRGERCAD